MNTTTDENALVSAGEWHRARFSRGLRSFAPLMPLSTFAGCAAVASYVWPVVPGDRLASWFNAGLLLVVALAGVGYVVHRAHAGRSAGPATARCRAWLVVASLAAGSFWGVTGVALLPPSSPLHQAALALTIAALTSLWLPLFVIERITVLTHAAPALLPMALDLLLPPTAMPLATMGSLLFIVLLALVAAAHILARMFEADDATHRALYHRATHDALVGLANHAEFERRVARVEASARGPFAVVFVDLDHFKRVNDTAGHGQGDRVLREIGRILRDEKRKLDVAARVGGDEFAILMELCNDYEALRVARAIASRIDALPPVPGGDGLRVTASIGVASGASGMSGSVVDAADRACYAAKRAGRNRIELARRVERHGGASSPPRQAARARGDRPVQARSSTYTTALHEAARAPRGRIESGMCSP